MSTLFQYRDSQLFYHYSLDLNPDPGQFSIHAHERPEVFLFISGNGQFLVEGTTYSLSPGDIMLMRPTEMHKLIIDPTMPYRRIAMHFEPHLFDHLDKEQKILRPFYDHPLGRMNQYPALTYPLLQQVFEDSIPDTGMERINILSRLFMLLTQITKIYSSVDLPAESNGYAAELVSYVNEHLFQPIKLSDIGQHFAYSVSQTSRVFREATGTSIWEYIMIKRLLAAREMLQRGEKAYAACESCGFDDYSSFYRAYKKRFGHSPTEDRSRSDIR